MPDIIERNAKCARQLLEAGAEIERLRAVLLNIQAMAERGFPIDNAKLAERCRQALAETR